MELKEECNKLIIKKEIIEKRINEINNFLLSPGIIMFNLNNR